MFVKMSLCILCSVIDPRVTTAVGCTNVISFCILLCMCALWASKVGSLGSSLWLVIKSIHMFLLMHRHMVQILENVDKAAHLNVFAVLPSTPQPWWKKIFLHGSFTENFFCPPLDQQQQCLLSQSKLNHQIVDDWALWVLAHLKHY